MGREALLRSKGFVASAATLEFCSPGRVLFLCTLMLGLCVYLRLFCMCARLWLTACLTITVQLARSFGVAVACGAVQGVCDGPEHAAGGFLRMGCGGARVRCVGCNLLVCFG